MKVKKTVFGHYEGKEILRYDLESSGGASVSLIEFGARLISVKVPDRNGDLDDVVLGYDNLEDYISDDNSFGATNGRVSNRIAFGRMTVDGQEYELDTNLGDHHIHGGHKGLKKSVWTSESFVDEGSAGVRFSILSPDGDEGYPGNLKVTATYIWNEENELTFDLKAETDKACPVNITQHAYFNLAGVGAEDMLDHELLLFANKRLEYHSDGIPTGNIADNINTPFDFSVSTRLGNALSEIECFDLNMVLDEVDGLKSAAVLFDPQSGRKLEITTSRPGLQVYSANHLNEVNAKSGAVYNKYAGISLEPQYFPDAVNHSNFPNTVLKPGEVFEERNVYKFSKIECK